MSRKEAIEALEIIRKHLCCYIGGRCDCKFGVKEYTVGTYREVGCGCPEIALMKRVLENMTDEEYEYKIKYIPENKS